MWRLLLVFPLACVGTIGEPAGQPGSGPVPNPQRPELDVDACLDRVDPVRGASPRLGPHELEASLAALLGFAPPLSRRYPGGSARHHYSSEPVSVPPSVDGIASYTDRADEVALALEERLPALLPCLEGPDADACARTFLADLVDRAYRGAAEPSDVAIFETLYTSLREAEEPMLPAEAIGATVSALLQSPGFLYLLEIGDEVTTDDGTVARRLTSREVANRMAYVFLDAPPSDILLAHDLTSATERVAAARELLADPRSAAAVQRFFAEWLETDRDLSGRLLEDGTPIGAELADAMREELTRLVADALDAGDQGLEVLLSADYTYVNRSLAEHYGLTPVPVDDLTWERVSLPEGWRAGVLSRGAFAASHSAIGNTSIILRGAFVQRSLLCASIPEPDNSLVAMQPETGPDATPRDRSEARRANPTCNNCHQYIDPMGLALDDFDHLGRHRPDADDLGALVDGDAAPIEVEGTEDVATALLATDAPTRCVSEQWFRFALGRPADADDRCAAATSLGALRDTGDLREMLVALVASESFALRSVEDME